MRALIIVASLAITATAAAQEPSGCDKFAWDLGRERAWFAAADKPEVSSGDTLAALPTGAVVIRLKPVADAAFDLPPERTSRTGPFGGIVRLPSLARPGIYQVTLSDDAWLDIIQNGRYARSVGSSGRRDCPELRKSVRFELGSAPVSLQVSGLASQTITFAIVPRE
jgi:hypothetical protein